MNEFNTRKLLTGAIACALVIGAVTFVQCFPSVSSLLSVPASAAVGNSASSTSSTKTKPHTTPAAAVSAVVNINTANQEQLTTLKGIGPAKADAIIQFRSKNGLFYRPEDIMKVGGIGKATFENIRDSITVGDVPPPPQSPAAAPPASVQLHILIDEVMTGTTENKQQQYIELFNPNTQAADLTGFTIKKKSSTGSVSTFVSASLLKGKILPAGGYFLLANTGYSGVVTADLLWPSSYTLASTKNSLMLYGADGTLTDSVTWSQIPVGKSYTRTSLEGDAFILSEPVPHNASH